MPAGEPPTLNFCTRPVAGSTRATVPPESATQTLPAPTATPPGEPPTGNARETRLVRGSTSSSRPVSALVTQIPRAPAASPAGALPRGMVATTRPLAWIDPGQRAVGQVGDPDRPVAERDRVRAVSHPDRRHDAPRGRVDLRDGAVEIRWRPRPRRLPTVTPAGPRPTGIRSMTRCAVSTRSSRSSALSVIQWRPPRRQPRPACQRRSPPRSPHSGWRRSRRRYPARPRQAQAAPDPADELVTSSASDDGEGRPGHGQQPGTAGAGHRPATAGHPAGRDRRGPPGAAPGAPARRPAPRSLARLAAGPGPVRCRVPPPAPGVPTGRRPVPPAAARTGTEPSSAADAAAHATGTRRRAPRARRRRPRDGRGRDRLRSGPRRATRRSSSRAISA